MICRGFKVTPLHLPSGQTAWRVTGTINGTQLRRQFAEQAQAEQFRDEQNTLLFGRGPFKVPVRTHLTEDQMREAEAVYQAITQRLPGRSLFELLAYFETLSPHVATQDATSTAAVLGRLQKRHPGQSVATAVDYYLTHYRPPVSAVSLQGAAKEYLLEREREADKRSLSRRQFEGIGRELGRLERAFEADRPLASLTGTALHEYLQATFPKDDSGRTIYSNKTWNNRRGYLTTFFAFCVQRGWLTENPAQLVRSFKRQQLAHGEIPILSAKRCAELMAFLEKFQEGRLVPFFALALFAGIRPDWQDGEISKLKESDFIAAEDYIQLGRGITKTRKKRHTVIQPNLKEWLTRYPIKKYPIVCANFKKIYPKIRKQFGLQHDVLRHTYCSMLVGRYRSVAETAIQAGNSEKVLWESYLNLVQRPEAEEFWAISPTPEEPVATPATLLTETRGTD